MWQMSDDIWQMSGDMWQMSCDMWQMSCDIVCPFLHPRKLIELLSVPVLGV